MDKEVLSKEQIAILPLLKSFSKKFCLAGGTAVALHIGHRRSIDFDLFSVSKFSNNLIQKQISGSYQIEHLFVDTKDEYSILVDGVKITFLYYPFPIIFSDSFENYIKVADLKTLAALKAYTLGRRAKWKDYADLFFILNGFLSIQEIVDKAKEIFQKNFSEKNFRVQLAYFKDIDFSEKVIFMKGYEISDKVIKKALINFSLS